MIRLEPIGDFRAIDDRSFEKVPDYFNLKHHMAWSKANQSRYLWQQSFFVWQTEFWVGVCAIFCNCTNVRGWQKKKSTQDSKSNLFDIFGKINKMSKTQLIPMRFIVMIGHLVLLILFLADQVSERLFLRVSSSANSERSFPRSNLNES